MVNHKQHPAFGRVVSLVNDIRLDCADGKGTLGEVAERVIKTVVEAERPVALPQRGWIPWKRGYDGWSRAMKFTDGTVHRVNAQNVHYPVSNKLAAQFRSER